MSENEDSTEDFTSMLREFIGNAFQQYAENSKSMNHGAPWSRKRDAIFRRIAQGENPFERIGPFFNRCLFHDSSSEKDLELLLEMAAEPGTEWAKRFLFCRNAEVDVPVKGRGCIRSERDFFRSGDFSLEGVEVMLMYGYELTTDDLKNIFNGARLHPWPLTLPAALLALAHVVNPKSVSHEKQKNLVNESLESIVETRLLERSTSGTTALFLAELLLQAGADPNHRIQLLDELDASSPLLYEAVKANDVQMVQLLIKYGADPSRVKATMEFVDEGNSFTREYSIVSLAERKGLSELLFPRHTPLVKPCEVIKTLHHEITKPVRILVAGLLAVTIMRSTGQAAPFGAVSSTILSFCSFLLS